MAKQTKMGRLFDKLDATLDGLIDGSVKACNAREIANLAGKEINTARTEIEYAHAKNSLGKSIHIEACE